MDAALHTAAIHRELRKFLAQGGQLIFPAGHFHAVAVYNIGKRSDGGAQLAFIGGDGPDALVKLIDLLLHGGDALAIGLHIALHALNGVKIRLLLAAQNGHGAFVIGNIALRLGQAAAQLLGLHILCAHFFRNGLAQLIVIGQRLPRPAQVVPRLLQRLLDRRGLLSIFIKRCKPRRYLQRFQLLAQGQIFFRRFRLLFQRPDLQLQLLDLIAHAHKALIRGGKLALSLLLAVAIAADAGGLLEYLAAVGGFGGHDLRNASLPDDGITIAAKAGVHEQLMDIAQADVFAVDKIFAVARAVIPARDNQLIGIHGEAAAAVVQNKRNLRHAQRAALFRSAEDDILHFAAAQRPRPLLAHDP